MLLLMRRFFHCCYQIISVKCTSIEVQSKVPNCRSPKMKWIQVFFTLIGLIAVGLLYYTFGTLIKQQCTLPDYLTASDIIKTSSLSRYPLVNYPSDTLPIASLRSSGLSLQSPEEDLIRGRLTGSFFPNSAAALPEGFQKALQEDERETFADLLLTLDKLCSDNNITFFMNYGTLFGSYRHHDMIPWDDDADVAMPYADRNLVWTILNNYRPGYYANKTADTQYRFIGPRSHLYSSSWEWRWPYIDIDLYSENDTHIWFYNSGMVYRYSRSIVFPLHRRPFGRLSLNSPKDGQQYLSSTYPDYQWCLTGLQHKTGRQREIISIPCANLSQTFPFVHRSFTWNRSVLETLKLGNKVLYSLEIDEPPSSGRVNPYTLKLAAD